MHRRGHDSGKGTSRQRGTRPVAGFASKGVGVAFIETICFDCFYYNPAKPAPLSFAQGSLALSTVRSRTRRPHMTGLKTILAAMALAAIFSTHGDAQRAGKVNSPASSATEVSRQPPQSARLALVVGNASYPDADAPLAQTVNDARALASTLRQDGFDVDLVQEATGEDMAAAIARLKAKVRPESTLMGSFAGVGLQSGGESYAMPSVWTILC